MIIRTVLGDVPADEMGVILPHEHTIYHFLGATVDHLAAYDRPGLIEREAADLGKVREEHGVSCIVDAAPFDLGRDPAFQVEVSRRSGVSIVAATGFFTESVGFPSYWQQRDVDALADFFTRELTVGVAGTDVRAGVIKVATGPGFVAKQERLAGPRITSAEQRAFRAAGRVQRDLGVGVITHTEPEHWATGNIGEEQLALLTAGGADPRRCVIGHASTTSNIGYLVDILGRGANVAFDTIGLPWALSDDVIAAIVIALVHMGYHRQLLLSHDRYCAEVRRPVTAADPAAYPNVDLGHIHREFLPRLTKAGVGEDVIHQIMVDNPRRILAFDPETK